ncbi:MAG: type II toxin-antitoxin system VapC family toxin [Beijerinckiaceae bacterium]
MRLLLDTHIAIWSITHPEKLSGAVIDLLGGHDNDVFVSACSIWEIAIKHSLGRPGGGLPFGPMDAIGNFRHVGYEFLAVTPEHAAAVETLPMHHGDPFDRLLIAQALTEPMRLVTSDAQVWRYGEMILRA